MLEVCEEEKRNEIPKLPLLNPITIHSPERSGTATPPLHITASIPFGWEEKPGKPRPCTTLVTFSNPTPMKCLELPPRLLLDATNLTKLSSPTTVLYGPYISNRVSEDCCDYERGKLGIKVLKNEMEVKKKGLFCCWRKKDIKVKKHVFTCSVFDKDKDKDNDNDNDYDHVGNIIGSHKNVKMRKVKHYCSSDNPFNAKSLVWRKIYEGWKGVVPWKWRWRSEKLNKYQCWWV